MPFDFIYACYAPRLIPSSPISSHHTHITSTLSHPLFFVDALKLHISRKSARPETSQYKNSPSMLFPHFLISTHSTPPTDPALVVHLAAVPDFPYIHALAEPAKPHTAAHTVHTHSDSAAARVEAEAAHSPAARNSAHQAAAYLHRIVEAADPTAVAVDVAAGAERRTVGVLVRRRRYMHWGYRGLIAGARIAVAVEIVGFGMIPVGRGVDSVDSVDIVAVRSGRGRIGDVTGLVTYTAGLDSQ
jgi:hypothetical protein